MNQKKFLAGVGIMLALGLLIAFLGIYLQQKMQSDYELPPEETVIEDSESEKEVDLEAEVKKEDSDSIILKKALVQTDENICHDIKNDDVRKKCFDSVRLAKALEINDQSLCEKIEDKSTAEYCADQIILKTVISQKNYEKCAEIKSSALKEQCLDIADKQNLLKASAPEDCRNITNKDLRAKCMAHFQTKNADSSDDCSTIIDNKLRQECVDELYTKEAEENLDLEICDKISNQTKQDACKNNVKKITQNDWAKEAVEKGDAANCASIIDAELKQKCKDKANFQAMRIYRDVNYCEKIVNPEIKTACFKDEEKINLYWSLRAKKERKEEYCLKITDEKIKNECITLL